MNKAELGSAIAQKANLTQKDAAKALDAMAEIITQAVTNGEKVQIVGFGTFERRERAGRTGKNPRTGESIEIAACSVPAFKPGQAFKDAVKGC